MPNKPRMRSGTTPAGQLAEASLEQVVGYQLAQATIATDGVFSAQVGKPMGLRRVEYTILKLIGENPACTATRVARALDVTAPNLTMWIDRLEASGLVVREKSTTDRRSQHLNLSAKGAKLTTDATQRLLAGERETLAPLSSAERAMLVELLHKVACCRPA